MNDFNEMTVGEIVSQNIDYASVFQNNDIDFCCGGDILLPQAVSKAGKDMSQIVKELNNVATSQVAKALNFDSWSLDLLIDYIYKFHHNYIRTNGPAIYDLLTKVVNAHGETDPHLKEVQALFASSLVDLNSHLEKEEQILFPYILEILAAHNEKRAIEQFHCGSVENPIRVMIQEHDDEGARFRQISKLTDTYRAPSHACNSYKLVLRELEEFEENLHIHIHVENNILFPKSIAIQGKVK